MKQKASNIRTFFCKAKKANQLLKSLKPEQNFGNNK
jgi:hypothetical protein